MMTSVSDPDPMRMHVRSDGEAVAQPVPDRPKRSNWRRGHGRRLRPVQEPNSILPGPSAKVPQRLPGLSAEMRQEEELRNRLRDIPLPGLPAKMRKQEELKRKLRDDLLSGLGNTFPGRAEASGATESTTSAVPLDGSEGGGLRLDPKAHLGWPKS